MRTFIRSTLLLGLSLIFLDAHAQLPPDNDGEVEGSPCIEDATMKISAQPNPVMLGDPTIVKWSVDMPSNCSSVTVKLNGQAVQKTGSRSVKIGRSKRFTLTISVTRLGVFQQRSEFVNVTVNYPPHVVINAETPEPSRALVGALSDSPHPSQVVEFCNVDIDLTGVKDIPIGDNRTLIASPGCERNARRLGPRIFITDHRGSSPLFVIRGDNVLVAGFRLQGPTDGIAQGDIKEKAILVAPASGIEPIRNIEISNLEVFHWSGLGIQVVDNVELAERGRLFNTNPNAVRVKNSFFHHNRHGAGWGYGVESSGGAYMTIERNVFDENRHAVAGGSRSDDAEDYSGYTLRDNLFLEGGGKHCADSTGTGSVVGGIVGGIIGGIIGGITGGIPGAIVGALGGAALGAGAGAIIGGVCWQTHQIDMHGDQNSFYSSHNWQCGTAGETMIIERNTILYDEGPAIKIRGNPADKAVVNNNVFTNDRSDAIKQNGSCGIFGDNISNPIQVGKDNVFDAPNPLSQLGSCDFFGDGQLDQFMATGVTWWAKSPVTGQWRYLNTMREKLPELQLGKVDGDNICDVAPKSLRPEVPPTKYSKSGVTPWIPLGVVNDPGTGGGAVVIQ